jgi:hypothetical protein
MEPNRFDDAEEDDPFRTPFAPAAAAQATAGATPPSAGFSEHAPSEYAYQEQQYLPQEPTYSSPSQPAFAPAVQPSLPPPPRAAAAVAAQHGRAASLQAADRSPYSPTFASQGAAPAVAAWRPADDAGSNAAAAAADPFAALLQGMSLRQQQQPQQPVRSAYSSQQQQYAPAQQQAHSSFARSSADRDAAVQNNGMANGSVYGGDTRGYAAAGYAASGPAGAFFNFCEAWSLMLKVL